MYLDSEFSILALCKSIEVESVLDEVSIEKAVHCQCASESQAFLENLLEVNTDLIVVHTGIGLEIIKQTLQTISNDSACKEVPIFVISEAKEISSLASELKDYPVVSIANYEHWSYPLKALIRLLQTKNTQKEKLNESLLHSETKNILDPLTGALNRLGAEQKFEELVADYEQYNLPFSIIMFDIDHFKKINDTYGHDVGDEILVSISSLIEHNIRKDDALIRFGGEEFFVFIAAGLDVSIDKAELFRSAMEDKLHGLDKLSVTASFGVVEYTRSTGLETLIPKVDALLYKAKDQGRNRVVYS